MYGAVGIIPELRRSTKKTRKRLTLRLFLKFDFLGCNETRLDHEFIKKVFKVAIKCLMLHSNHHTIICNQIYLT